MSSRWIRKPAPVLAALLAFVALAAAGIATVNLAFSGEGSGVAAPEDITPIAFTGYPTNVAEPPRGLEDVATCQAPAVEREGAEAPPLSCRYSGAEPALGSIETPSASEIPNDSAIATSVPNDWTVINNTLFRLAPCHSPGLELGYASGRRSVFAL
jgi:hypothetical protein